MQEKPTIDQLAQDVRRIYPEIQNLLNRMDTGNEETNITNVSGLVVAAVCTLRALNGDHFTACIIEAAFNVEIKIQHDEAIH